MAGNPRLARVSSHHPVENYAACGLFTRNHAAYNAGKNNKISAVATMRPPMMATAIGPKKRCVRKPQRPHWTVELASKAWSAPDIPWEFFRPATSTA